MSTEFEGVLLSAALVCGVLFFGWAIGKIDSLPKEFSRKFVHIGVSCFYFIYAQYLFGTSLWLELILPVLFIMANAFVAVTGKPKALSKALSGGNKFGTVYYPVALVILILLTRISDIGMNIRDFGAGVLAMGFGDGLAGLVGAQVHGKKIPLLKGKTWVGSTVMLVVSFFVIMLVYWGGFDFSAPEVWLYLGCAAFATVVEALTPFGLDNISVPVLVALFCMLVV